MLFPPLLSALAMLLFGLLALRLNARRPTNLILAAICFLSAAMFTMQLIARYHGALYAIDHVSNPMPWVRLRFACIGLLCPLMVWACYYIVSGRYSGPRDLAAKLAPWAGISLALIIIPFTEAFKSSESRPDRILDGPLYPIYFAIMLGCQIWVCAASISTARTLRGIRRLEFKFITIAFGYLGLAAIAAALIHVAFRDVTGVDWLTRALAVIVFLAFGLSSWSVTSRRVYHSGQVLVSLVERCGVAITVGLCAVLALHWIPAGNFWPKVAVVALAGTCFHLLDDRLRELLNLKSEQRVTAVARQLHAAALVESEPASLLTTFEAILSDYAVGSEAKILTPEADRYERGDLVLSRQRLWSTPAKAEGWVSVVSLSREAKTESVEALTTWLGSHHLHLLISPRWSEHDPAVVIAFGERENGLPFTYPEIKTLLVLAEIADGLYTRSRFALQARQAEQLATIGLLGAGLAHELRNPISVVDTFAQLLPTRMRDAEFLKEFAAVIPGETKRIQALAEQLLDLSRPRKYEFGPTDVHAVIAETLALLKQQARAAQVRLINEMQAENSRIVADPRALRQVLLNLILNSIQSIAQLRRAGRVVVRTFDAAGSLVIETEDDGPGIPESIRGRLFRPFVSAGKEGGLGLGLATCAEIAKIHHGEITAMNRSPGAVFRIKLPIMKPNGALLPKALGARMIASASPKPIL